MATNAEIANYLHDLVVCARHLLTQMDGKALAAVSPAIAWAEGERDRLRAEVAPVTKPTKAKLRRG